MSQSEECTHTEEQRFLEYVETGETHALSDAFHAVADRLLASARSLARNLDEAEDLVQETLLTAIVRKETFRREAKLLPWLRGILTNHVRSSWRGARRGIDVDQLIDRARHDTYDPVEALNRKQVVDAVRAGIAALPSRYRDVVSLHVDSGLSADAIAQSLDRPGSTVRTQLSRGLKKLRLALPSTLALSAIAYLCVRRAVAVSSSPGQVASRADSHADSQPASARAAPETRRSGVRRGPLLALAAAAALLLVVATGLLVPPPSDAMGGSKSSSTPPSPSPDVVAGRGGEAAASAPEETVRREVGRGSALATITARLRWASTKEPAPRLSLRLIVAIRKGHNDLRAAATSRRRGFADETGVVRFEGVPPGEARFLLDDSLVKLPGFVVEPAAQLDLAVDVPEPARTYRGVVVSPIGEPVEGAEVWVSSVGRGTPGYIAARTGPDGRYEAPVFYAQSQFWARARGFAPSTPVLPGAAATVVEETLTLQASPCRLTGTVMDRDGYPLADAVVGIYEDGQVIPGTYRVTNPSGVFSVDDLRAGAYRIAACCPELAPASIGTSVRARADNQVTLTLGPPGRLEGRIIGSPGVPWGELRTALLPMVPEYGPKASGLLACNARFAEDGRFSIENVSGGLHLLGLYDGSRSTAPLVGKRVWIVPGRTNEAVLVLRPGRIQGRVVQPDGRPVPNAHVFLLPAEFPWRHGRLAARSTLTDETGDFELKGLKQREYACYVFLVDPTRKTRTIHTDLGPGLFIARTRVVLGGPRQRIEVPADLSPSWIRGRVEYDAEEPLRAEKMMVEVSRTGETFDAVLDAESGEFSVGPLLAGHYRLLGTHGRDADRSPASARGRGAPSSLFWEGDLAPGVEKDLGTVCLRRSGVLAARFATVGGEPVPSGAIKLMPDAEDGRTDVDTPGVNNRGPWLVAPSYEIVDGNMTPAPLFPGRYRYLVSWGAFSSEFGRFRIEPGRTTRLGVTLQPATLCEIVFPADDDASMEARVRIRTNEGTDVVKGYTTTVTTKKVARAPGEPPALRKRVFRVGLAPGAYVLEASIVPGLSALETFAVGPPAGEPPSGEPPSTEPLRMQFRLR